MTSCTKVNDMYTLDGLSLEDLELIEEAIIRLFNESHRQEHRWFRLKVLKINRAIDPILEENERTRYELQHCAENEQGKSS